MQVLELHVAGKAGHTDEFNVVSERSVRQYFVIALTNDQHAEAAVAAFGDEELADAEFYFGKGALLVEVQDAAGPADGRALVFRRESAGERQVGSAFLRQILALIVRQRDQRGLHDFFVGQRDLEPIAEALQLILGQFLLLVGDVQAFARIAHAVAMPV